MRRIRETGMTVVPTDIVAALSLLNSHARAHGCGKEAIYSYKLLAALLATTAGESSAKPVATLAKCHFCLGTGKFFCQYEGQTNERCRKCSATGRVLLRFIETEIAGHRWHHPWIGPGQTILYAALGNPTIEYEPADRTLNIAHKDGRRETMAFGDVGDWAPNAPGEKLTGERAAELLNLVEDWVLATRYVDPSIRWRLESAQRAVTDYSLDLGRIGEACHYCRAAETTIGQGHYGKPFKWSVHCCAAHERMPVDQWDNTVPAAGLTPAVLKWAERRAVST